MPQMRQEPGLSTSPRGASGRRRRRRSAGAWTGPLEARPAGAGDGCRSRLARCVRRPCGSTGRGSRSPSTESALSGSTRRSIRKLADVTTLSLRRGRREPRIRPPPRAAGLDLARLEPPVPTVEEDDLFGRPLQHRASGNTNSASPRSRRRTTSAKHVGLERVVLVRHLDAHPSRCGCQAPRSGCTRRPCRARSARLVGGASPRRPSQLDRGEVGLVDVAEDPHAEKVGDVERMSAGITRMPCTALFCST